ncbi:MAG: hypothetical protein Q8P05_00025 [Candidatus Diapherotrites archaeon]|nr:hypothetical protein [Candidatus Diapherotrites archaeon]MDZ4256074.1 hypothetical protein [archaeon]
MQMAWGLLFVIVFLSGCVDYQLTGAEIELCLASTETHVTHIPWCDDQKTCTAAWEKASGGNGTFSPATLRAEKSVIESWIFANRARDELEKTGRACAAGKAEEAYTQGVVGAHHLKKALYEVEQAQLAALDALREVIEDAHTLGLEEVRDSEAFQAYAEALTMWQDIQTGSASGEVGRLWKENNAYLEDIGEAIQGSRVESYAVNQASAFSWFETALKRSDESAAKQVLRFSSVWQSLLSAVVQGYDATRLFSLVGKLEADEMMERVENGVGLDRGIVPRMLHTVERVRTGVEGLEADEIQMETTIRERIQLLQGEWEIVKEDWRAWEKIGESLRTWTGATLGGRDESSSDGFPGSALLERHGILRLERMGNTLPLGKRVVRWRTFAREVEAAAEKIEGERERLQEVGHACVALADEWRENEIVGVQEAAEEVLSEDSKQLVDSCERLLVVLAAEANQLVDLREEDPLVECNERVVRYANALGDDTSAFTVELWWQAYPESELAVAACQSRLAHYMGLYESDAVVQEWMMIRKELRTYAEMLSFIVMTRPEVGEEGNAREWMAKMAQFLDDSPQDIISLDIVAKKNREGRDMRGELDSAMQKMWQAHAERSHWKLLSGVRLSHPREKVDWEWKVTNPFGEMVVKEWVARVDKPGFITLNSTGFLEDGGKLLIPIREVGKDGIILRGTSDGTFIRSEKEERVVEVVGEDVGVIQHMTWDGSYFPVSIALGWEVSHPKAVFLSARNGKGNVEALLEQGEMVLRMNVEDEQDFLEISYIIRGGLPHETRLVEQRTHLGQVFSTYEWHVKNTAHLAVATDIPTSIQAEPLFTSAVRVDEGGREVAYMVDRGNQVILEMVALAPGGERTFNITIVAPEDLGVWRANIQSLLDELDLLEGKLGERKKWEVDALRQDLLKLLAGEDRQKIAAALPGIRKRLDTLWADHQAEEKEFEYVWREFEDKPTATLEPERLAAWRAAMQTAIRERDLTRAKEIVEEVDLAVKVVDSPTMEEESTDSGIIRIEEWTARAQSILDAITAYKKELGITCPKLGEVGYVCPMDEKQIKELGDEMKSLMKQFKGVDSVSDRDAEEIEAVLDRASQRVDEARQLIREMGEQSMNRVINTEWDEPRVVDAIQQGKVALAAGEWGKAIYIGENIRRYLEEWNAGSGLATLPPESLPVIGIGILAGGGLVYRYWKRKHPEVVIPKRLPRASSTEKVEGNTKMAFPRPVSRESTKETPAVASQKPL